MVFLADTHIICKEEWFCILSNFYPFHFGWFLFLLSVLDVISRTLFNGRAVKILVMFLILIRQNLLHYKCSTGCCFSLNSYFYDYFTKVIMIILIKKGVDFSVTFFIGSRCFIKKMRGRSLFSFLFAMGPGICVRGWRVEV